MRYLLFCLSFSLCTCTLNPNNEVGPRVKESLSGSLSIPGNLDPTGTNSFSFAVFGDTHVGGPFGSILDTAVASSKAAGDSFVIVAGDLTDFSENESFDEFISTFSNHAHEYRATIGNHDIYFRGWDKFKNKIGAATYSFDADNVHFAMIDTANGLIGKRQLDWLRNDLSSSVQPIKVIVSHFSPYTGSIQKLWTLSSDEESAILKDIAHNYGVQLVIGGHYHGFEQRKIGNTTYITTGGVNRIIDVGEYKHYVRIHINGTDIQIEQVKL